ncbi:unnamed protein product [Lymnaea stagnalis]|uniref:Large ribosomal subunit protein uL10m n=1 Tax=Lymnaea stagnalis TaxID=6523 RepID=A0AAV2IGE2_LYMST
MASTCGLVVRQFSTSTRLLKKPNISKPRVPWTERRILNAVTIPLFPPDPRPLPQKCFDELKSKEESKNSELSAAYQAFRLRQTVKMFNENQMVAICHILPMAKRDAFNVRTKIVTAGMGFMFSNNKWSKAAVENTRLRNLEPYFTSDNVYIVSQDNKVKEMVAILRKTPELQLLGGLVENQILSRDMMMNIAKLPPLDVLRGELVSILSASAAKTSRLLGKHQQDLAINLDQLVKQGSADAEAKEGNEE